MIATAMLVALGFFAATLLALFVLPFVTRRAERLTEARLSYLMPLSASEIAAERDGIRALAAVEQRRLEQKLEDAATGVAEAEAALGRRTAALVDVEKALAAEQAERSKLAEDLAGTRQALLDAQKRATELELTLGDLRNQLRAEEQEHRALLLRRDELEILGQEQRSTIASLETRCAGLDMRVADRDAELERGRTERGRLRVALTETGRERDLSRNEVLLVSTQRTILQDDVRDLTRRAEDYRTRLQAKSEALITAERRLMEETAERKVTDAALVELRQRFEALEGRLIESGGQGAALTLPDGDLAALRASITSVADEALHVLGGAIRSRQPPADGEASSVGTARPG